MDNHATLAAKFWAWVAYLFSGGLVLGDALDYLNDNPAVIGLLGILSTSFLTMYYKRKEQKTYNKFKQQEIEILKRQSLLGNSDAD